MNPLNPPPAKARTCLYYTGNYGPKARSSHGNKSEKRHRSSTPVKIAVAIKQVKISNCSTHVASIRRRPNHPPRLNLLSRMRPREDVQAWRSVCLVSCNSLWISVTSVKNEWAYRAIIISVSRNPNDETIYIFRRPNSSVKDEVMRGTVPNPIDHMLNPTVAWNWVQFRSCIIDW